MSDQPFPFNRPQNTEGVQELLYRLVAMMQAAGGGINPAVRDWKTVSTVVAGGTSWTPLSNQVCKRVLIFQCGVPFDVQSSGATGFLTNMGSSSTPSGVGYIPIDVKNNAAEILIRRTDGGAAFTINCIYQT